LARWSLLIREIASSACGLLAMTDKIVIASEAKQSRRRELALAAIE
jgi:hypothetical protein